MLPPPSFVPRPPSLIEYPHPSLINQSNRLNQHCSLLWFEYIQLSNEFKFPLAAVHHAHEAYLVTDVLKRAYGGYSLSVSLLSPRSVHVFTRIGADCFISLLVYALRRCSVTSVILSRRPPSCGSTLRDECTVQAGGV